MIFFFIVAGLIRILYYLLPILVIVYGVYYLINRFTKKDKNYQSQRDYRKSDDIIDVEFTVHEEEED